MNLPGHQTTVTLADDVPIPIVGLGTWAIRGRSAVGTILSALEIGYRHFDTASMYGNEEPIGRAVLESGLPRDEVFITSKVWSADHGYDSTLRACDTTLRRLETDYVDLYLIHWPKGGGLRETWQALETLYAIGKARAIGVSNYTVSQLRDLLDYAHRLPAANQIELHPWNHRRQQATVSFCREHGIEVEAYTPLNKTYRFDYPTLQEIAHRHQRNPAQIVLRWDIQHRYITIPKSSNPDHQRMNLDVFDFELTDEEMAAIDGLR
jgi:diketogulonate reductase-like aldo/keto reductase